AHQKVVAGRRAVALELVVATTAEEPVVSALALDEAVAAAARERVVSGPAEQLVERERRGRIRVDDVLAARRGRDRCVRAAGGQVIGRAVADPVDLVVAGTAVEGVAVRAAVENVVA